MLGSVLKRAGDPLWRLRSRIQSEGVTMIAAHVVRVFEDMARKHRNDGFFAVEMACGNELSDARHRRSRSGFATDAVAANHRFGVGDFLFAHGDHLSARAQDSSQRLLP